MAKLKSKLFSRKFRNWFLGLDIARQDLKSILGYTLQALKQDGALFQTKVAILQPLFDGFDTGLTTRAGADAGRSSQTLVAETTFALVQRFMKRAYKKNFAALEEDNPELYRKLFPEGRTQFTTSSRQKLGTAFSTFVLTLTDNVGAVPNGAALLAEAKTLQGQYATSRLEQAKRKKLVKTAATTLDADEATVLTELFGVYAALLAQYYKTPERAATYFDFSVLPPSFRSSDDEAEPVDQA